MDSTYQSYAILLPKYRVGRTARLGEKGDSLLFLQPVEIDYLKDLEKHGVMLTEYPLLKLLSSFPLYNLKHQASKFVSIEMHPWLVALQRALESFVSAEVCHYSCISNAVPSRQTLHVFVH